MGHWTFDGNTEDSSENQNHGNLISGEFVADREGNPSSALYMDGLMTMWSFHIPNPLIR